MRYRTMPKNGDELSVLGFGCMRLPMMEGGKIHVDKAVEQVRQAIDNGVNYLDTAWPYHGGASETIVGTILQDGYRDKVKIATKLPTWLISRAIRSSLPTSLQEPLSGTLKQVHYWVI